MIVERREVPDDTPRIGWWWGVLLLAVVLWLLGGDLTWPVAVTAVAALIAWTAFIVILQLERRRARWR